MQTREQPGILSMKREFEQPGSLSMKRKFEQPGSLSMKREAVGVRFLLKAMASKVCQPRSKELVRT
eukprot:6172835-Pleurochrysis_carterae.AAC.1